MKSRKRAWSGQKGQEETIFLVRGGGGEIKLTYKRFNLTYYGNDEARPSGWVMHQYQIVDPPLRLGAVLARVKITDAGKEDAAI